MIPDEAVEAAAKAHYERQESYWEDMHPGDKAEEIGDMRAALEAALPYLLMRHTFVDLGGEPIAATVTYKAAHRPPTPPRQTRPEYSKRGLKWW